MRVIVFIGVLFIIAAVSAVDFTADLTITGGDLSGIQKGKISYKGVSGDVNQQKQRIEMYDSSGALISTEINDYVTGTAVTFANCGGGCKASPNKITFPAYWKDGNTAGTEVVNGVTCEVYARTGYQPQRISFMPNSDLPCRAVYSSGAVYTFSNAVSGVAANSFDVGGWNCPVPKCAAPMNVILVMDRSGSIDNNEWAQFRNFAIKLVQGFDIAPNAANVGAVLFSSSASIGFGIQTLYQNAYNAILGLQRGGTGNTCIGCGLDVARSMFNNHGRKAKNVYIVMTDGENNVGNLPNSVAQIPGKDSDNYLFAVGIGQSNSRSLQQLTSTDKILYATDFANLDKILSNLIAKTCSISDQLIPGGNQCGSGCKGGCNCGTCQCPTTCDDGDKCTTESCRVDQNGAGCTYKATNCDDGNFCTKDSCNSATGCLHENIASTCVDNNKCTVDNQCDPARGCYFPARTDCDLGNKCMVYGCDPATGCTATPRVCEDNNPCTTNGCDPKSGCTFIDKVCDDNKDCTANLCNATSTNPDPCYFPEVSSCKCSGVVCRATDACHPSQCNPRTGECDVLKPCDDNNVCTSDSCAVVGGNATCTFTIIPCDTSNKCRIPTCDPIKGCQFTNLTCNDGNLFTDDICNSSVGCQFTPKNCDDKNACTRDYFNETLNACVHEPYNVTDHCNDNSVCTIDTCNTTVGCVNTPINCSAAFCDAATCHSILGCQNNTRECPPPDHCQAGFCNVALNKCDMRPFDVNETFVCDKACSTIECQFANLSPAEKAGVVIGAAAIAGIAIGGAVGLGLLIFGGKKGYDYLMARNAGKASLGNNPLYVDDNRQGANPLYKE